MNYQKAYLCLFNQITDLTEQLKAIQCQADTPQTARRQTVEQKRLRQNGSRMRRKTGNFNNRNAVKICVTVNKDRAKS